MRIVHLSPSAGLVDLYVTSPGTEIADVEPAFTAVDFKGETGYVDLPAGSYEVTVAVAGTKTAAIGPTAITISDGGIYTAVARDAPGDPRPTLDRSDPPLLARPPGRRCGSEGASCPRSIGGSTS